MLNGILLNGISRKQAGILYRAFKTGELLITQEEASRIYNTLTVDYVHATTNSHDGNITSAAQSAIDACFNGDFTLAADELRRAFSLFDFYYKKCKTN